MKRRMVIAGVAAACGAGVLGAAWEYSGTHRIPRRSDLRSRLSTEYNWSDASGTADHGPLLAVLEKYLSTLPEGAAVVDLGCGNGALLARFRTRPWKLVGVDSSASGIAIARKTWPSIRFLQADATGDLECAGYGSFDAVITMDVIEHVFAPRALAANCRRLLKPGGLLLVGTPYHGYVKNLAIALSNRWDDHVNPLRDFGHIKFWSADTLSELLFETGFEDIEWCGVGRMPLLWTNMVMKARLPGQRIAGDRASQ